jgi:hypothetical protein
MQKSIRKAQRAAQPETRRDSVRTFEGIQNFDFFQNNQ